LFFGEEVKFIARRFADHRFIASRQLLVSKPGFVGLGVGRANPFDLLSKEQIIEVHPDVSRPASFAIADQADRFRAVAAGGG
jgi:hypothetical protein